VCVCVVCGVYVWVCGMCVCVGCGWGGVWGGGVGGVGGGVCVVGVWGGCVYVWCVCVCVVCVCVSSFRLRAHLALLLSPCLLPFPAQEVQSIWPAVWRDDCVPRSIQATLSHCMAFPAADLVSCSFCLIACLYLMA